MTQLPTQPTQPTQPAAPTAAQTAAPATMPIGPREWHPVGVEPCDVWEYDGHRFSGYRAIFERATGAYQRTFTFYLREHAEAMLTARPGELVGGIPAPW